MEEVDMHRTATRLISVSLALAAVASPALGAQPTESSSLLTYLDEIAMVAAVAGGLYLVDRASWSFLTGHRTPAPEEAHPEPKTAR